jgi:hypothetical protein
VQPEAEEPAAFIQCQLDVADIVAPVLVGHDHLGVRRST